MANKQFTVHAQKQLNKNPNVVKCSPSKIVFTEEFALKVVEALMQGRNPAEVFEENGLSVRVLGKSRVNGIVSMYKSKYELENLPRRQVQRKEKKHIETSQERREKNLKEAVVYCDNLIANKESLLSCTPEDSDDVVHFKAIKKTYENKELKVIVKNLCAYYGYDYLRYYAYFQSIKPKEDDFVNILNSHKKR